MDKLTSRLEKLQSSLKFTQPLSKEKKVLKDIDRVKSDIAKAVRHKATQATIDALKSECDDIKKDLSLKLPAIDELRAACQSLKQCADLGLKSVKDLAIEAVECGTRLPRVIGKVRGGDEVGIGEGF